MLSPKSSSGYSSLFSAHQDSNQQTTMTKISLEEAEQLCGFQLLTHAHNLTKIIHTMRDLKKAQRQYQDIDPVQQQVSTLGTSRAPAPLRQKVSEKDKLMNQKRDLQQRLEMKKHKYLRNERQKEQFRAILFKNFSSEIRGSPKKGSSPLKIDLQFQEIPSNLNSLYFDSVEEKIFTQSKTVLFAQAIRNNMNSFIRVHTDLNGGVDGKRAALKIMSDLNQNLKRKYIKKCLDYKRVCKGEDVDEPRNFFQQFVFDLKKEVTDAKSLHQPLPKIEVLDEQTTTLELEAFAPQEFSPKFDNNNGTLITQEEQLEHTRQYSETKAKMQQQQIRHIKNMEQLEVKTISERSQEDSEAGGHSMFSSKVSTPMHHKNYLSGGGIQRKLQGELELNESQPDMMIIDQSTAGGLGKKQMQILDLLNEICEDAEGEHKCDLDEMDRSIKQDDDIEAETEKEENAVIDQIMKVLQTRGTDSDYQSLTYTDGIYLQNITGDQLEIIIKYLHHLDDPESQVFEVPDEFKMLMELFETAEYLGLDQMKIAIVQGILQKHQFLKFTNVRRHYIDNLQEDQVEYIYEHLNPDLLVFILSDPALEQINQVDHCKFLFEAFYAKFTHNRLEYLDRMKDEDSFKFVFDEDLQYLTKEYYEIYNDTDENLSMRETIASHIAEMIKEMREEFKALPFDFHSCFYYDVDSRQFRIHRNYLQQDDTQPDVPFIAFKKPLILFSAIEASSFGICLTELFGLSKRFAKIRILNIRGFIGLSKEQVLKILKNCEMVSHLNLSFVKAVDDDVIDYLGSKFAHSLLSLELRACSSITDNGIIKMCEGLSGIKEKRGDTEPASEHERYRFFNRHEIEALLKHLNVADLKQITNKAMKSIAFNLFPALIDLSIWGCYKITNEGFLELCTATRSDNFRRVNYCGCYKISDDSRLWISSSFTRVIIYNKVDDFGKDIDYTEFVNDPKERAKALKD